MLQWQHAISKVFEPNTSQHTFSITIMMKEFCYLAVEGEDGAVHDELKRFIGNVIVTNPSVDMVNVPVDSETARKSDLDDLQEEGNSALDTLDCIESHGLASPSKSACISPASSNGGVYSVGNSEHITDIF